MNVNRKKIITVDDNIINLTTAKNALTDNYDIYTVPSGEKLFKVLEKTRPDLILLDIDMPVMNGYEVIRLLKNKKDTANIPVIFLTSIHDPENELEAFTLGAIDYITKPFSPTLLSKRIEVHLLVESQRKELQNYNENLMRMVREKTNTVFELQNAVLKTVAELVECRDDITGGHIERTQGYLKILISDLIKYEDFREEISHWDLDFFILSAQLHDVGKVAIKDNILLKPGKLTVEEFEEMKKHTTVGANIIKKIENSTSQSDFLKHAEIFAGSHHEKWDGTGYPLGLKGSEIPLEGRLMAIVDVYDALTNERPYKDAYTHEKAVEIIKEGSGSHFDPKLVVSFLDHEHEFKNIEVHKEYLNNIPIEKTEDIYKLQKTVSKTISELVEYRDGAASKRIERLKAYLGLMIGPLLEHKPYKKEVSSWDKEAFFLAAEYHDVGKIAIKDTILLKPDKLTNEEYEEMKKHTTLGAEITKNIGGLSGESTFLNHVEKLNISHHENWDGTGYPSGLKGDTIPLQGRLMSIVETYEALTHDRPYKKACTHSEAVEIIRSACGIDFDPGLVEVFL
ncbi:MAG: HD domain-containing protein, partial [Clostridiales bacterium]|nr:HD domain-containing protein [Clostridiales bacterium]